MSEIKLQLVSLARIVRAVESVRERLLRSTAGLGAANVPYAVIGGNAVAAWVPRVDEAAVRNTIDIGLIDSTWLGRFQPALASRLQDLLDDREG